MGLEKNINSSVRWFHSRVFICHVNESINESSYLKSFFSNFFSKHYCPPGDLLGFFPRGFKPSDLWRRFIANHAVLPWHDMYDNHSFVQLLKSHMRFQFDKSLSPSIQYKHLSKQKAGLCWPYGTTGLLFLSNPAQYLKPRVSHSCRLSQPAVWNPLLVYIQ